MPFNAPFYLLTSKKCHVSKVVAEIETVCRDRGRGRDRDRDRDRVPCVETVTVC